MKALIGKAVLALAITVVLANPPRKPLKTCGKCQTQNEPDRTSCIGCGAKF